MKWVFSVILFPLIALVLSVNASALSVSAGGAVIINGQSGEILWEQNCRKELSMASTTKIMTALLLCESGELDREITVTEEMVTVEGSSMGLLPGDKVTYRGLLYGMMLASGNDAANTVAIALGGDAATFSEMMNAKAAEIGMKNTNFVTPSGLDSASHYSTAYDMALLARYALKNADFREACSSQYATLFYGNPPYRRTLKNHNKLLFTYEGAIGVKTGYTKKSGRCLVSAAVRGDEYIIAVTLSDPNDWADHKAMLDYGFSAVSERVLLGESYSLPLAGGGFLAASSADIKLSLSDSEYNSLEKRIALPRFLYEGVSLGEEIGRVEYYIGENRVATAPIKTDNAVPATAPSGFFAAILLKFKMLLKAMI
ncbi:MAG: D-alanyl-D-alanine carboxypeptidase [Clostridia bacterium]|nr:D-alanyl-D-alanine carboxypeptidase [Clostridia bacterium]